MNQENIIKILTGGMMVAKKSSESLKEKSSEYLKEKVLNNEFVTREEFAQLRNSMLKLSEELESIKKTALNK
ncbi:MAG: hypothetical protein AB8B68_02465 [Rickettsiaceae bacterium]